MRLWDWRTGRLACPPMENDDEVHHAAFTRDGRWGLAACRDGFVRIWDLHLGTRVGPPIATTAISRAGAFNVALTPNGRTAVIGTGEANFHVIDLTDLLATDGHGAADLGTLAELTTGHQVDAGNLGRLTEVEWLARCARSESTLPASAGDPATPVEAQASTSGNIAARLDRALLAAARGDWSTAAPAFAALIRETPRDASLVRKIGNVQTLHARWADAASTYAQILQLDSINDNDAYHYAALLLETGAVDAYRRHCRWILDQYGKSSDRGIGRRLGKACLIASLPGPDQDQALRWANIAADESIQEKQFVSIAYFVKSLAEYRAERPEQAITWTDRIVAEKLDRGWQNEAPPRAIRLLAQLRLGHRDEARRQLGKLREDERTRAPKPGSNAFGQHWVDRLFTNALLREAESALRSTSAPAGASGSPR